MRTRNLALDLLLGAAAGAVATWTMDRLTTTIYERQPDKVREREDSARGEKTAYEVAAEKGADRLGKELTDDQRQRIGSSIHWSLGVMAGAAYGVLRNAIPAFGIGSGVAYGAAFWLAMDEAAVTALGLAPSPRAFPWQTHARGLAGHLVLGAVIEAPFDLLDLG
jgi:uncharacterized protein DUF1440